MSGNGFTGSSGEAQTYLITLYLRAMESQRPDALIKDERAVALVERQGDAFARIKRLKLSEYEKAALILRSREFDRYAREFLSRRPEAAIVHIGCGLDSRFERVDNGLVEWYDLDLPEVIGLRRKLIADGGGRHHLLGCSVCDEAWLAAVDAHSRRPFLFLAEGVSMYLHEGEVKRLILVLRDRFPGSELIFDALSPLHIRIGNLRNSLAGLGIRFSWGLWRGQEIEGWGDGIRLLDEWGYFDSPEPRLAPIRWMRHIPFAAQAARIYHFSLGASAKWETARARPSKMWPGTGQSWYNA